MSPAWSFAIARLFAVLAIATLVGFVLGQVQLTVVVVLAGYLALNFVRLYRLERWLRRRRTEAPPDFQGVWGDIIALIMRIYRRKQFHKRRIVQLFREFRRMTSAMPDGVVVLGPTATSSGSTGTRAACCACGARSTSGSASTT